MMNFRNYKVKEKPHPSFPMEVGGQIGVADDIYEWVYRDENGEIQSRWIKPSNEEGLVEV